MGDSNGDDVLQQIEQDAKAWERDLEVDRKSAPTFPSNPSNHTN